MSQYASETIKHFLNKLVILTTLSNVRQNDYIYLVTSTNLSTSVLNICPKIFLH